MAKNDAVTRLLILALALSSLLVASGAAARDTPLQLSIESVMNNPEFASRLAGVSFYFGNQKYPEPVQLFGEFRTNKKTNAFNKSDVESCEWAMLSALLQFHSKAVNLGANAVVNIQSNYKNNLVSSETDYSCGAGALMSGVALIATIVTIDEPASTE